MSRKSHAHGAPAEMKRTGRRRKSPESAARSRKRRKKSGWRTAATSDKYDLYERSVQEPAAECAFIEQVWKEKRRRRPRSIREDFCGTAAVCMEWVKRNRKNTAVGVDVDPVVLEWGRKCMPKRLKPHQMKRVRLVQDDVRHAAVRNIDSVLASNFSHFIFKTRDELRRYYRSVCRSLKHDGIFILDAYGGSESYLEMKEDRDLDGFTYIWDQNHYNPIDHHVINHIHFAFPDGTRIRRAFTYDWRLWTLPEIQEILLEAGFTRAIVYWEGTDQKTGEGNGEWAESTKGEACLGWIAYIVGLK